MNIKRKAPLNCLIEPTSLFVTYRLNLLLCFLLPLFNLILQLLVVKVVLLRRLMKRFKKMTVKYSENLSSALLMH